MTTGQELQMPAPAAAAIAAARPGWKTSEFWLSVLGVAGTLFAPAIDHATSGAADQLSSNHGAAGAIAAGVIVGAYTIARAMTKAAGVKADAHASSSSAAADALGAALSAASAPEMIPTTVVPIPPGYPDASSSH